MCIENVPSLETLSLDFSAYVTLTGLDTSDDPVFRVDKVLKNLQRFALRTSGNSAQVYDKY